MGFPSATPEGWLQLHPEYSPPVNGSEFGEATFDPRDNSTIYFQDFCSGGHCPSTSTWLFNGTSWAKVVSPSPPGTRTLPRLTYDGADGSALLYGGQTWNSTWEFLNGSWTNVTRGITPGSMYGVGMAYDAFDKYVLLFGGSNSTGSGIPNETWDFAGGNWTRIVTQGQGPPDYGAYSSNPMVYDAALESVVLFENTNWTYLYRAGTWQAVFAPIPVSLEDGGGPIVYDAQTGEVDCVGGYQGGTYTNQTWAFNGTDWSLLTQSGGPPPTIDPTLAYDPVVHGVLLYGGLVPGVGGINQTWVLGAGSVAFEASPSGGGNFELGEVTYVGGNSSWIPFGTYQPKLLPNPGFHGINFSVGGNLTPFNGSYRLTGNATILGQFAAYPRVSLATLPSNCDVEFNNTLYASGSSAPFIPGTYALIAPACPHVIFKKWLPSENASLLNVFDNHTTVTLSGPSTLTAEFLATVTFEITPSFSGTIFFNGTPQVPSSPQDWPTQNYSLEELATPGWRFAAFSASGGIQLAPGSAAVEASGVITASFVQFPTVTLETSLLSCSSLEFNDSSYASGSEPGFLLGSYSARAPVCSNALFEHWSTSGGVTVASPNSINTTANVTGNGTLTAVYGPAAWVNLTVQPSAAAGSIVWNGTPVPNGSYFETLTGDYSATAHPANGWHFLAWETQGGIRLVPGSFALSSNASLTADFQINATSPGGNQSGAGVLGLTTWEWVALGVVVVGALALTVVVVRRRRRVGGHTEDRDNP
jgi:List-Bact-rpt repeat protein